MGAPSHHPQLQLLLGPDDVQDCIDQRQVGECLREVAQVAAGERIDLLGEQRQRTGQREKLLAQTAGAGQLADFNQRGHQPERADREGALLAGEAVVGLLNAVAQNQAVLGQLVGDRQHRGTNPLILGGRKRTSGSISSEASSASAS